MLDVLRRILSRLWLPSDRPFARLVRHFLMRLARSERDAASSEVEVGAGALLGLLSVPGALTCFMLLDKYSTFLDWYRGRFHQDYYIISIPDKYLFIALAMAVTGIVTVLKWDKILPDAQDYLNLAPLPILPRNVLLANASALAIAVVIFAIDVNSVPGVFFPLFVTTTAQVSFFAWMNFALVHALCVVGASIFTFCAVFALLGAASAVLPHDAFRACATWLRGAFLVVFLLLLVSGAVGPRALLTTLQSHPDSAVRWLPSLWFLGLYQTLQHRPSPLMTQMASMVLPAMAAALALAIVSYGLSYRRRFVASLEGMRRPADQLLASALVRFFDLFAAGSTNFVRASYRFTVRAILRSETHRLCIAVSLGIGWLAASQENVLAAPLTAAYVLVLGLRLAFELPAGARAAWIFRAVLDPHEHATLPVARRVIFAFVVPLVLAPAIASGWWVGGPVTATLHGFYLLVLCIGLVELQLHGYRKIPVSCPLPGFRDSLVLLCFLQFLGFLSFTGAGAGIERWMLAAPLRFLWVPAVMVAVWYWRRRNLREAVDAGEVEEGLTFDNIHTPAVERLNLS